MDMHHTPDSESADLELNERLGSVLTSDIDDVPRERRQQRIAEYAEECLHQDDPFSAMIGASNAEFQRLCDKLAAATLAELDACPASEVLKRSQSLMPQVRTMLQLRTAIERSHVLQNLRQNQSRTSSEPKARPLQRTLTARPRAAFPK